MTAHRRSAYAWSLTAAFWLAACEPPPPEPSSDSQTNWLLCNEDADCASGQACVIGVCRPTSGPGARVAVDTRTTLGSLVGFGAAVAYAEEELAALSREPALEQQIFGDLGLDVLRLRNRYGDVGASGLEATGELLGAATRSLGRPPLVLLSSWSPPAELKQNGTTYCGDDPGACTLRLLPDGQYDYAGFAAYWRESLDAYAAAGVTPDYIGIQNNPDWVPPPGAFFEACRLLPSEGTLQVLIDGVASEVRYPGYDRALQAVAQALEDLPSKPLIAAPEISSLHRMQAYVEALDVSRIHALAHHLYGQDPERVDMESLQALKELERATALPLFQSEMQADGYGTALLIHHALVTEGASMYLHAALAGPLSGPLANPFALIGVEGGELVLQEPYFAMRHYARFTEPGFRRVAAGATHADILPSAWLSPDEQSLVVVLVNAGAETRAVDVDLIAARLRSVETLRTVFDGQARVATSSHGELAAGISLPPRSVATLRYAP